MDIIPQPAYINDNQYFASQRLVPVIEKNTGIKRFVEWDCDIKNPMFYYSSHGRNFAKWKDAYIYHIVFINLTMHIDKEWPYCS